MPTFLKALSISNYRGIGARAQRLSALSSFNFFIGPNNAGKSTVLNLVSRHLSSLRGGRGERSVALDRLEQHAGAGGAAPRIGIGLDVEDLVAAFEPGQLVYQLREQITADLRTLGGMLADASGTIWFEADLPMSKEPSFARPNAKAVASAQGTGAFNRLHGNLLSRSGGDLAIRVKEVLDHLEQTARKQLTLPRTALIPALRQVGPKGASFDDLSGVGLIDRLAELQNPAVDKRPDRDTFDAINDFVRVVTDSATAQIEIPHDRQHVLVHMNGRVLPLENLGTGIQQVVMIAAFCTMSERMIVCIEEPELHLHPLLQRKLVDHLRRNTSNQYFVATHSASFIDTPGSTIFHVRLDGDGTTSITPARLDAERFAICADLGHRASDIVQTNAVLWVEGPSDRIYLKHWIRAADDSLVEGTHYSIMFYGGRLLSHLGADDGAVDDLIKLRDLNRNLAIMMDSDKDGPRKALNATKCRIEAEFSRDGAVAWITRGREVENYVRHDVLQAAVKALHSVSYDRPANAGGRFDRALEFMVLASSAVGRRSPPDRVQRTVDKVRVARAVCQHPADFDVLDLRARVGEVVAMIRRANRGSSDE